MNGAKRSVRIFGLAALLVLAALAWVSSTVVGLETARAQSEIDMAHARAVDVALERMDAWVSAQVAAEAARPPAAYRTEGAGGSWLAGYRGRYVKLHFAMESGAVLTSPQASPESAAANGTPAVQYLENRVVFDDLAERIALLSPEALRARVVSGEAELAIALAENVARDPPVAAHTYDPPQQRIALPSRGQGGRAGRNADIQQAVTNFSPSGARVVERVGLFVPVWVVPDETLVFARRVETPDSEAIHGFAVDWPMLRGDLLHEIDDLFPTARLEAVDGVSEGEPALAAAPVALRVDAPPVAWREWTVSHTAVAVTWLFALLAFGAGAWSLRSSHAYAERRSRFASAVTHELRTPLTTFRMYADMLESGMVPEDRKGEYLSTLKTESERLATLVENVLAFSRLERGAVPLRPESITLRGLVDRLREPLDERVARIEHELEVVVRGPADEPLHVDADAVGRVLLNLIDNACKYGASTDQPTISLTASVAAGSLRLEVADHGPGVPRADRAVVFESFRRGRGREDGSVPGVGLGLALSRELARAMGGDLVLVDHDGVGASFALTVPVR